MFQRADQTQDIPWGCAAIGDPGAQTLQIIDIAQMFLQFIPDHEVIAEVGDRILTLFDLCCLDQRIFDPFLQQTRAHGTHAVVHEAPQ